MRVLRERRGGAVLRGTLVIVAAVFVGEARVDANCTDQRRAVINER